MIVLSREDADAPRAMSVCAPITTAYRQSAYEVELPRVHFLPQKSFVNLQASRLQAMPVGRLGFKSDTIGPACLSRDVEVAV
jgi:mRNA-degrading endonuclease toxin of MazEF toxin-antitoxin module